MSTIHDNRQEIDDENYNRMLQEENFSLEDEILRGEYYEKLGDELEIDYTDT